MLFPGDLGFSSPVAVLAALVVASLAIPLFVLFVRRRWEFYVARNEEVRRLLELASEEAARAEIETLQDWWNDPVEPGVLGSGSGSDGGYYCCAVCYSPTTTRCSRCKAVRYCSGKCQIVHWRQGHREECHPPEGRGDFHGNLLMSDIKVPVRIIEDPLGNPCDDTKKHLAHQGGLTELISAGVVVDEEKKLTESPASSPFSGFSCSVVNGESSDDLSSCESFGSDDSGKSYVPLSVDITHEASKTIHSAAIMNKDDRCSPKFSILVDAVESFKDSGELDGSKDVNEGFVMSSLGRQSSLHKNLMDIAAKPTSNFWGPNLDSNVRKRRIYDGSSNISPGSAGGSAMSDSKSVLRFSFSFSDDTSRPVHKQEPKDSSTSWPDNVDRKIKNCGSSDTILMRNKSSRNASDEAPTGLHNVRTTDIEPLTSRPCDAEALSCCPPSSPKMDSSSVTNSSNKIRTDVKNIVFQKPKLREAGYTTSTIASHATPNVWHSDFRLKQGKSCDRLPSVKNGLKTSVWRVFDQLKGSVLAKHHRAIVGIDMSERDNVKALLSYDSFAKLYTKKCLVLLPCGLVNCGNSCYANVVLQCLAFTPPLTAYFLQGLHSEACSRRDWCFTCEFERLILKFKEGKSPISPIGILSHLRNIGSQLGNGREEDAHEFLWWNYLFNPIQMRVSSIGPLGCKCVTGHCYRCAIDRMQSDFLTANSKKAGGSNEEEMTLVGLTFGGYLRSKIRCLRCNGKTERQERLMDLTVEIEGDIETLEDALRRFTGSETLDGENKYQCGRCKTYEKARKKLTLLEAPNILTIAFKRYQSGKFGKLNKAIRFSEIIDLASFIEGWKGGPAAYRVYGVIVHLDIMNSAFSGHYVCYVRNTQDRWFKIDDSTVKPVELEQVLTKDAYMLLYARCSPQAPRLIRDRSSHHDSNHLNVKSSSSKTPRDTYPSRTYANDSIGTEYSRFHHSLIPRDDSSSDISSLFSSNSDESSYSMSSTQDSSSYDDDIFGELDRQPLDWSSSSDSYTSSR